MAQHDYIISNQTFPNTRADLNNVLQAIATCNKGSSAPTTQYAGQMWIDDSAGTTWTLYLYDGSDNIQVATIDTTANTINFIDSVVTGFDIVTDTTPQLGGDLDLNSNDITGTGNINITGNATASGDLTVDTNTLKVDSTNNSVGIGTSSPARKLTINNEGNHLQLTTATTGSTAGNGTDLKVNQTSSDFEILNYESANITAWTSGLERLRIDSSGNLLVDKTSSNGSLAGAELRAGGRIFGTTSANAPLFLNRLTSDGTIATFRKDGNEVGTIVAQGGALEIGSGDVYLQFNGANDWIKPVDGSGNNKSGVDLGTSGAQFDRLYLSGGALITEQTLTDGATISWDVSTKSVAKVTLGGNRTISAPSNAIGTGQFVSLLVIQDGTGSRTLTWNAVYEFASDTAPTLTTTASKGDLFVFRYNGTKWLEVGRNLNLTLS